jgi:hypothetical protein
VQRATSWRDSLILAGVFELLIVGVTIAALRLPAGEPSLGGVSFDRAAWRATLTRRDLRVYGAALFGGYGAYLATSPLLSEYVTLTRGSAGPPSSGRPGATRPEPRTSPSRAASSGPASNLVVAVRG